MQVFHVYETVSHLNNKTLSKSGRPYTFVRSIVCLFVSIFNKSVTTVPNYFFSLQPNLMVFMSRRQRIITKSVHKNEQSTIVCMPQKVLDTKKKIYNNNEITKRQQHSSTHIGARIKKNSSSSNGESN